jgi:glycosyltransferase involved in cell wall biosynthesis
MKRNNINIKKTIKKRILFEQQNKADRLNKSKGHEIYVRSHPVKTGKKINVIISAYDCAEFIEECLNSIEKQTYKCYKILLGIDGCEKTLEKIKEIHQKYSNLYVYYSEENNGPYQMFNALIQLVPNGEYIQIFGADDVMNINMLENMSKYEIPTVSRNDGVLFINKNVLNIVGGFRDWKCGADSDMIHRITLATKSKMYYVSQYFFRREHDKQLTKHYNTNFDSNLRKRYIEITENNKKSKNPDIYITPICSIIKRILYETFDNSTIKI